ncbi:MAG TPA: nitroreductase family deazaflavin-dependent oxidoreductase [Lacisediminihabitans sp.]|uniref:nitroreductase family deazaflavin-dependent oxidoreductase n=1 Tax=Lacisediminihabitans sp. TaxID=2787631 RepID=UPI002EDB3120
MSIEPGTDPLNPIDNDTAWVATQIAEYVATDGASPQFRPGVPLLLLTVKGRQSGAWRRTALIYGEDEGRFVVVASRGGAPRHPVWYLNLRENSEVYVQVGARRFRATARTASQEEKPDLWAKLVAIYPEYADYQTKTDREIPVVILDPLDD